MGFVARTIFWLGLVYSAMPLDFASLLPGGAAGVVASANPMAECAHGLTGSCRQRIEDLRRAVDAAAALGLIDSVVAAAIPTSGGDVKPGRRAAPGRSN